MEKRFRIWTYKEGEPPLFQEGPMNDIYSIEGQFMDELSGESPFSAKRLPMRALAFFSSRQCRQHCEICLQALHHLLSRVRLQNVIEDFIGIVSKRYPYWKKATG
ncbi:hypothetical protein GBA52_001018 [Prunus armeniaca]|nr:hypothetical protein GBA52_001018 [Prunus armeniaca]